MTEVLNKQMVEPKVEHFIVPKIRDEEWVANIACDPATGDEMLPRTRSSGATPEEKDAISRYCVPCLAREECLVDALRNDQREGIRGGIPESQRKKIHDEYQKYGEFSVRNWSKYLRAALATRESFTVKEKVQLAKQRNDREQVLAALAERTGGEMDCKDIDDLSRKLAALSGIHRLRVKRSIEYLAQAGKIERRTEPSGKKSRGRLIGVRLDLDAA